MKIEKMSIEQLESFIERFQRQIESLGNTFRLSKAQGENEDVISRMMEE